MGIRLPGWMGLWFSVFPDWETVGAQLLATILVIGTYLWAQRRGPRHSARRGERSARRRSAVSRPADSGVAGL